MATEPPLGRTSWLHTPKRMPFDGVSFDGMPANFRMRVVKPREYAREGSVGQPKERNYFSGAAWEAGDIGDVDLPLIQL